MVIVDTSVWIRALTNRVRYRAELDSLLDQNEAAGHELVYGELLVGDRGARRKLLADYRLMHFAKRVPHADVVSLVQFRKLHGRGAGWIDVHLLASAMVEKMQLWTADEPVAALAADLGVAYQLR